MQIGSGNWSKHPFFRRQRRPPAGIIAPKGAETLGFPPRTRAPALGAKTVKSILKAELARRNVTYKDLAERLQRIGVKDTERNISNKISRGTFTVPI